MQQRSARGYHMWCSCQQEMCKKTSRWDINTWVEMELQCSWFISFEYTQQLRLPRWDDNEGVHEDFLWMQGAEHARYTRRYGHFLYLDCRYGLLIWILEWGEASEEGSNAKTFSLGQTCVLSHYWFHSTSSIAREEKSPSLTFFKWGEKGNIR